MLLDFLLVSVRVGVFWGQGYYYCDIFHGQVITVEYGDVDNDTRSHQMSNSANSFV